MSPAQAAAVALTTALLDGKPDAYRAAVAAVGEVDEALLLVAQAQLAATLVRFVEWHTRFDRERLLVELARSLEATAV